MDQPDIFLSYNREDSARAKQFADTLVAEGFTVWWDASLKSGENYDEVTETALLNSRAVVVLWSQKSVVSRWVRAEATEAERAGKLVPAMIEPCKRPIMFELKQTAELSHWKGNRKDAAWCGLVADLRKRIGEDRSSEPQTVSGAATAGPNPSGVDGKRWLPWAVTLAVILFAAMFAWTRFDGGEIGTDQSIEVLVTRFAPAGSDPGETAIANGITDELIVRLRRIPELRVISGVAEGDDTSYDGYRIDGSVRLDGDNLRVSPRLLGSDGSVLWTSNFERRVEDLFEVQEAIASAVASTLSVSLDVGIESKQFGGTDNPEAFANYVQGRVARWSGDPQRFSYLERAVALDPGYIKAWTELAYANGLSLYAYNSWEDAEVLRTKMDQASAKALNLNPDLWVGQAARGWYEIATDNFASADKRVRRIAEQDLGNDPEHRLTLALFQNQFGRYRKSAELRQSLALIDPIFRRDPALIDDLLVLGQFEEVIRRYEEIAKERPGEAGVYAPIVFWAILLSGDSERARQFAVQSKLGPLQQGAPDFRYLPDIFPNLPLAALRDWADRKFKSGGRWQLIENSWFASRMGNRELAMDYLRIAFEHKGIGANHLIWHPVLSPIRQTDAFEQWITERGIVAAWRASGDWGDYCRPVSDTEIACK